MSAGDVTAEEMEQAKMIQILMSRNSKLLLQALLGKTSATVEAEYGDQVVSGSVETLAHHGPRAGNPCPCLRANNHANVQVIGVSHLDLDAIGGVLSLLGQKPEHPGFWTIAAEIDIRGAHRLPSILDESDEESEEMCKVLYAWWAWSEKNRVPAPADDTVVDVTEYVDHARRVLEDLLDPQPTFAEETTGERPNQALDRAAALIDEGQKWMTQKASLERASFRETLGSVTLRESEAFTNHLYAGSIGLAALNTTTGAVTLSLSTPIKGVDCAKIAQSVFGPLAGGRAEIAGSPRGERCTLADARRAGKALAEAIAKAKGSRIIADCAHCEGCGMATCPLIDHSAGGA